MAETKPDRFMTWIALTTAIMAVFAAITTLYVGKYSSRAVLYQGEETDMWAYFQAKSIKQHAFEMQKEKGGAGTCSSRRASSQRMPRRRPTRC